MQTPSAPCDGGPGVHWVTALVKVRACAFALTVLLLPGYVWASHGYWIEAEPADAAETALRDALARSGFGGPAATAELLRQVSAAQPGTVTSGLAQLAAGLLLLDANKHAEALPALRHADVARTALPDHALFAVARAQEMAGELPSAGVMYLSAADARPGGPLTCVALVRAGEVFTKAALVQPALDALNKTVGACPDQQARVWLAIGGLQETRHDPKAAAQIYDRLCDELPTAPEAGEAARRLTLLGAQLPALPAEVRAARLLKHGLAYSDARRWNEAVGALRAFLQTKPAAEEAAQAQTRLGHALLQLGRVREAELALGQVPVDSSHTAEAFFELARCSSRRTGRLDAFEGVATHFPGTAAGEEALLTLANEYQKDYRNDEALPYYRRMLAGYPDGRYADRAAWRVAWAEYRAGNYELAAQILENATRLRPSSWSNAGFLYWAGRSRRELGQADRARVLLEEAVRRFKHTYYGQQALETLATLPPVPAPPPSPVLSGPTEPSLPAHDPQLARLHQLLLIDRLDEARDELATLPASPQVLGTAAWIEWRRGRLRPAIIAMKRAYPEYAGESGDHLPEAVWRILYPMEYSGLLQQKAGEEALDPALVAALICQESTFNAGAISVAGARGLMQVIPKTARVLAHTLRVAYRPQALYDPAVSLDFGTRYLHEMLERFGGRVERALAAYNAGPHRVDAWTRDNPNMSAEEFIESIPFTETRLYVMTILGSREQYRRIYSFPAASQQIAGAAGAPAPAAAPALAGGHP